MVGVVLKTPHRSPCPLRKPCVFCQLAELRKRVRLARATLDARVEAEDRFGRLTRLLDLRRPLPGRKGRKA